ncbi:MAG: 3-hydroxyanthranilate 3,4-dioxygenase, partial [Alphaproteobacteria bacterium]|nr:3-hydroxyanthranilate 3,4-dioxygenase [Alphaproteobacteria bacterium]
EEFFYQLEGDMILKIHEAGAVHDVPIREGDIFLLPAHTRHSPQRPMEGSVGLVVEPKRPPGVVDGFEWFCFACGAKIHRVEVLVASIVDDLPPLFEAFFADEAARTCPECGALHPGKEPPEGWVSL